MPPDTQRGGVIFDNAFLFVLNFKHMFTIERFAAH